MSSPRAVKQCTTGKHVGYGKVILFGEHFVVFGADAIVAGISEYTTCQLRVTPGVPGVQVEDDRPAVPGYIKEKRAEQEKAHELVLQHLKIDTSKDGLHIHLGGPLVPSSGIGASASDVVALSRALSELFDLGLTEEQVNQSAFVGEGGYHGTPSGVDNTAATFGGLISYRRTDGKSIFHSLPSTVPLYLVVVGTGITASTTKVVGDVRKLKESRPGYFTNLTAQYSRTAYQARKAIAAGDVARIGRLMTEAHDLLRKIGVSCEPLEQIVSCCMSNGALGAKLSGTGRGGIAVALVGSNEERDKLEAALKQSCPAAKFIWKYTVSPKSSANL